MHRQFRFQIENEEIILQKYALHKELARQNSMQNWTAKNQQKFANNFNTKQYKCNTFVLKGQTLWWGDFNVLMTSTHLTILFWKIQTSFFRPDRIVWNIKGDLSWIQFVKPCVRRTSSIGQGSTGNVSLFSSYLITKATTGTSSIRWCFTTKKHKTVNVNTGWILISECLHAETASQSSCWYELCCYINCTAAIFNVNQVIETR